MNFSIIASVGGEEQADDDFVGDFLFTIDVLIIAGLGDSDCARAELASEEKSSEISTLHEKAPLYDYQGRSYLYRPTGLKPRNCISSHRLNLYRWPRSATACAHHCGILASSIHKYW